MTDSQREQASKLLSDIIGEWKSMRAGTKPDVDYTRIKSVESDCQFMVSAFTTNALMAISNQLYGIRTVLEYLAQDVSDSGPVPGSDDDEGESHPVRRKPPSKSTKPKGTGHRHGKP